MQNYAITSQNCFTAMKGHVAEGAVIKMGNGDTLKIKNEMKGWIIIEAGNKIAGPFSSALEVEIFIVNYGV